MIRWYPSRGGYVISLRGGNDNTHNNIDTHITYICEDCLLRQSDITFHHYYPTLKGGIKLTFILSYTYLIILYPHLYDRLFYISLQTYLYDHTPAVRLIIIWSHLLYHHWSLYYTSSHYIIIFHGITSPHYHCTLWLAYWWLVLF
jgi:hypothetical protein